VTNCGMAKVILFYGTSGKVAQRSRCHVHRDVNRVASANRTGRVVSGLPGHSGASEKLKRRQVRGMGEFVSCSEIPCYVVFGLPVNRQSSYVRVDS
jgi:hypothetical protein